MSIRLVIADDHTLVRQGVRRVLEGTSDVEVVGEASNGRDIVGVVATAHPDVALIDIRMPEMNGLEAARAIRRRSPETRIVMLTAFDQRQFVAEAVRAGARGYVLKAKDAEHLVRTVRQVASGAVVIDPELVLALAEQLPSREESPHEALTSREVQVLQLVATGKTNREIARTLFISPDTVKTHLEHIFQKLNAADRTAAVAEAFRRRLIE
ncbi:MAG: response regulator [Actinomycetota bacterium]